MNRHVASLARLDSLAHFLYCPAMGFSRCCRARWYTNVHLIRAAWLGKVCDRYDAWLGVTPDEMHRSEPVDWFDDPTVSFHEAMQHFERLGPEVTVGPQSFRCPHVSIEMRGGTLSDVKPWCGCHPEASS